MADDLQSLEVGTVVKISQIVGDHIHEAVRLREGMEGIVWWYDDVFKLDEETPSVGEGSEQFYTFELPGSRLRIGPVGKMPPGHKCVVWIVANKIYNVTSVHTLFTGHLRWWVVRTGEVLRLTL